MPVRQNILITGASSGLGAGMAREFAARGRNLALCARRLDRLEALQAELIAAHPGVRVMVKALDVRDYAQVFEVFRAFDEQLGPLDRVIVNAGVGNTAALGSGRFEANRHCAETNFIGALAQMEAALELFRSRNAGHLVVISSMSGIRGLPNAITTYAATKAGVASLAEGARAQLLGKPIKVTTVFPGYIRSEMTAKARNALFMVDTEVGVKAITRAIESEPATAYVPRWPWLPIGLLLRVAPLGLVRRFG